MDNPNDPNDGVTLDFTLGDRLRKAREYAGLEIQELAEAVDVHRQSVTRYENDRAKPKRGTVLLWSMATGVSVAWLEGQTPQAAESAKPRESAKP
jgi:transcriptional regulator with XRE-family HTH domain